jgi:uncharacterized protein DUF2637
MTAADRVIRWMTAGAVVGVSAVAAVVSYEHAGALVRVHGESGWTGLPIPLTVDGFIYASSMVMLDSARRSVRVPPLSRWPLGSRVHSGCAGTLATVTETLMDSVYLYDRWYGSATTGISPTRVSGRPAAAQEVPVLTAHVLGGDRTGDPARHPPWLARRPGTLAGRPRYDLPADHGPRLVTNPEGVRPLRRRRRRRHGRSANAAGQVTLSGYPSWKHSPPAWCPIR